MVSAVRPGSGRAIPPAAPAVARATIRPTTSSRDSAVESISTASAAIAVCGGVGAGPGAACSACGLRGASTGGSPASSAVRRSGPDRCAGGQEHLDRRLRGDHGADVAALGHDPAAGGQRGRDDLPLLGDQLGAHGPGTEATALTALDTSRVRIGPATSAPSTLIAGAAGSVPGSMAGSARHARRPPRGCSRPPRPAAPPGQRPVHGPGVQIAQAEGAGRRRGPRWTCRSPPGRPRR